jgi:glycosyltransferase involved in cell wall biosynthesis
MKEPGILYLVPDLFGPPSGIARYCRMVCRALTESHQLTTVSLLDATAGQSEAKHTFPGMRYLACDGNRRRFVQRALRMLRYRPEIVLVGHPNFAPLGWLLAKLSGARLVTFIYGIDAWEVLSFARRRALCASDGIISISRFTAKRAAEVNGIPLEKVRILHNCLDPHFEPASIFSRENAPLSLLTVARMSLSEQYKGHDVVIRALPQLLQKFPSLIYNVVGGGDGRAVLETLATKQGVTHAVHFHGVVSEAELVRHYNEASVFVMPSRFEGFGFVFLEAMTYGKPVVAGNEDASVEVVRDGESGFTVAPGSTPAVAAALETLLRDADLRRTMGRRGRAIVEDDFSFEQFKSTLMEHLQWAHR